MSNNKIIIPIVIGIIIVIGGIVVISNQESNTMEVENTLDKELTHTEETTPEIQEKIDEIESKNLENEYSPKDRKWISSGPFSIDRSEYILGEKIFMVMSGLGMDEKGQIAVLRPLNDTHYSVYQTYAFDGASKQAANIYFEADLSKSDGVCTVDDLVGDWIMVFRGTDYPNLEFKVTDDILPGDEEHYEPCMLIIFLKYYENKLVHQDDKQGLKVQQDKLLHQNRNQLKFL